MVSSEEAIILELVAVFGKLSLYNNREFRGFEGIEWKPVSTTLFDWLERSFKGKSKDSRFFCDDNSDLVVVHKRRITRPHC